MLPIRDIIPTRTPPAVTVALIAANVLAAPFIHDGVLQLAIDMLCLWIFGGAVEDRMGHARFAAFYLLCVSATCGAQSYVAATLTLGAGGAVGGIMGAYFLLFPKSRVLTIVPFPPGVVEIPAAFLLGVWFSFQFLGGMPAIVALIGSVAGFLSGGLLCLLLRRPERARVEWWSP